jgi:DNA polymerase-3 subunit delta
MDILKIKKGGNLVEAVDSIRPPVFWKDKQNLVDQAKVWNIKKILIILQKLYDFEIILKSSGNINKNILIKKLLIDVCYLANS